MNFEAFRFYRNGTEMNIILLCYQYSVPLFMPISRTKYIHLQNQCLLFANVVVLLVLTIGIACFQCLVLGFSLYHKSFAFKRSITQEIVSNVLVKCQSVSYHDNTTHTHSHTLLQRRHRERAIEKIVFLIIRHLHIIFHGIGCAMSWT